ncbi:hypothetical protein P1P75_38675 [Streptomyces sp. ID05-39B]|uniref:hypothetical protein n=1 Tax=Streptomyces sp. ID05-39B TaxID=3028664 RepID=UPI00299FA0AB|nr:hypothetical protein [Streptomyces sp. ID05-39B]MDX3532163.1 hypothetical protein [Streptomyces sp. ID05-39B]
MSGDAGSLAYGVAGAAGTATQAPAGHAVTGAGAAAEAVTPASVRDAVGTYRI